MRTLVTFSFVACTALPAGGQPGGETDRWAEFEYFVGAWTGDESATFGDGRGERTYELVLQDRYLSVGNRSVFPPQDGLPGGDDHGDWSVFSYDTGRDTYVLRQFNSEGFVNHVPPRRFVHAPRTPGLRPRGIRERARHARHPHHRPDRRPHLRGGLRPDEPGAASGITIRGRWTRTEP